MIWINISNILKVDKFSGIARTEYELCLYAYTLSQQGYAVKFSTFDDCLGFVEMPDTAAANKAIAELNGAMADGRAIRVNEARPREERPARPAYNKSRW